MVILEWSEYIFHDNNQYWKSPRGGDWKSYNCHFRLIEKKTSLPDRRWARKLFMTAFANFQHELIISKRPDSVRQVFKYLPTHHRAHGLSKTPTGVPHNDLTFSRKDGVQGTRKPPPGWECGPTSTLIMPTEGQMLRIDALIVGISLYNRIPTCCHFSICFKALDATKENYDKPQPNALRVWLGWVNPFQTDEATVRISFLWIGVQCKMQLKSHPAWTNYNINLVRWKTSQKPLYITLNSIRGSTH
jgi:hypothetical protein